LETKLGEVDHLKLEPNISNQTACNCGVHSFQNKLGTLCLHRKIYVLGNIANELILRKEELQRITRIHARGK
jgi:hypothetical protein